MYNINIQLKYYERDSLVPTLLTNTWGDILESNTYS